MPSADGAVPHTQSAFRRAVVPLTLGLGSLAAMGWLAWALFEGQREDVATARAFLTHIAAERHSTAVGLMTPALAQDLGTTGLQRRVGALEPWDHIGFSSRNTNGMGETRITELVGVGEAISGCESILHVQIVSGEIESFDIAPLCPRAGTDV